MQYGIGGAGLIAIIVAIAIIVGGPSLATISANQAWAKAMVEAERTTRMMIWCATFLGVTIVAGGFGLLAYFAHLRASFGIPPQMPQLPSPPLHILQKPRKMSRYVAWQAAIDSTWSDSGVPWNSAVPSASFFLWL